MGALRLPLAAALESRDGTLARDARMKNTLAEAIEGEVWAVKRPGIANATATAGGAAVGQGMVALNGQVYVMAGDVLYKKGTSSSWSQAIPPVVAYNFAMTPGPTDVLSPSEWLSAPYYPPYYPSYTLKDYATIDAIVAQMNSAHSAIGPWSYRDFSPAVASEFANYPWYKGWIVCPQTDEDGETYVNVLRHSL